MARISTHVLDIEKGKPTAGIGIELRFNGSVVASSVTNADGRTDAPLLSGERIETGMYQLLFHTTGFFEDIAIQFHVTEPTGNYHVPLLLAGHGYSTYRGS
jgi:5-hydroxyisourate hydrolase